MNTRVIVKNVDVEQKVLKDLSTGDWFFYNMPNGTKVIAIKGDDTVYNGEGICCMLIEPAGGIIARIKRTCPVRLIEVVDIKTKKGGKNETGN